MRGIILAAGEGSRLRPFTLDRPKCLVEIAGHTLLDYQLAALDRGGVDEVVIVTGYRAAQLESRGRPTRHNPEWASTNMVATLMCAADLLDGGDDVLIAYADLVYEARHVEALLASDAPLATTIDLDWQRQWELRLEDPLEDAETLRLDGQGQIVELGRKPRSLAEIEGQYMGLIRVDRRTAPRLVDHWNRLDPGHADGTGPWEGRSRGRMFMTSFLQDVLERVCPLTAVPVRGGWFEVDSVEDLELYGRLHRKGRLASLCRLPEVPA